MRRFGGMTRSERFAASTQQVSPLPIPLPLQNEVVDERRLLTVPWVSLFQWILNIGTRTFVTGTHADRIDDKNDPAQYRPGTWFWETDRTVLYQVRIVDDAPHWVYVLGTMYGTLTPDQQPDDLGPYDAGFQFAAEDTGQTFLWDGTAWVDITSYPTTTYGTHAERLAQDVDDIVDGTLWAETDRGNALYQIQAGVWWYIAGTMFGTLAPDQRPADLGVHDAGFDFRTSVPPAREFMWSQTAWVELTPVTGASNLTHPNVVTKVSAVSGEIVEGGITDESAANSGSVRIASSGKVGIGVIPAGVGVFQARGGAGLNLGIGGPVSLSGAVSIQAINDLWSFNVPLEIRSSFTAFTLGNVSIGTTVSAYQLQLSTDSAGKPATSTWSVVSDLRLKQNIEPVKDDSLAILAKLDWVRYEYNGQANMPQGLKAIGLAAQALEEQLPEAVRSTKTKLKETDDEETDVLAIDYHHILVHSARAIQQLEVEVKSLREMLQKQQS